jgi:hypothetical protein
VCETPHPLDGYHYYWEPGDPTPRFESLASWCRCREIRPTREHMIYFATAKAIAFFGGVAPSVSNVFNVSHDLMTTEIFLALRALSPETAERWVGEDLFAARHAGKLGDYVPDAAIFTKAGVLSCAIEFGGRSYTPDRFREIHAACSAAFVPFQIW